MGKFSSDKVVIKNVIIVKAKNSIVPLEIKFWYKDCNTQNDLTMNDNFINKSDLLQVNFSDKFVKEDVSYTTVYV